MIINLYLITLLAFHYTTSLPTLNQDTTGTVEILETGNVTPNKTTENPLSTESSKQYPEDITKVVADHPLQKIPEYPIVTKHEPQLELDKLTLEELKVKCEHLAKVFNTNQDKTTVTTTIRPLNHKYPDKQPRPVYTASKPNYNYRYPVTKKPNGFYITGQPITTKKPTIGNILPQPTSPVKYIRLEPVILQKTILGDGRTVFYWHKSLPTAVEYPNNYATPTLQDYQSENDYQVPNYYGYSTQNGYYVAPQRIFVPNNYFSPLAQATLTEHEKMDVTTETTTTTTETNGYSYGLSNFIPFYHNYNQESTPETESPSSSTTSTPSTTPKPTTNPETNDLLYAQQLKFIIPVPIDDNNGVSVRQPWDFDQYAYYPKGLQPNGVNIQVPYSPTFHMIRAVTIPKNEGKVDEVDGK